MYAYICIYIYIHLYTCMHMYIYIHVSCHVNNAKISFIHTNGHANLHTCIQNMYT